MSETTGNPPASGPAPLGAVWLLLVALTIGAWETSLGVERVGVVAVIVALSAVKVGSIIFFYMEIHCAPRWLQIALAAWVALVFGMIGVCLLLPVIR
jgi:hypothetical protein